MKTLEEIKPFPFLKISTMCLSQGKLFNINHVPKPDTLCACNWRLYSTNLFLTLRSSPLNFDKKPKALIVQLSPSNTKVYFKLASISCGVISRFYLAANLLNR